MDTYLAIGQAIGSLISPLPSYAVIGLWPLGPSWTLPEVETAINLASSLFPRLEERARVRE